MHDRFNAVHASIYVSCHDTRRVENELWRTVSADIAMRLSFSHREKSSSAILFDESRSFDLRLIFAPFLS